jgi:CheY-like chemotaxis protein
VTAILVVDDNNDFRAMLKRTLTVLGYDVYEACDGDEGLLMYLRHPVDLVIADLIMQKAEGLELIRILRSKSKSLQIIAISGGGFGAAGAYLRFARELGANHILEKPFTIENLVSVIDLAIGAQRTAG